jgi:hypothetical protein
MSKRARDTEKTDEQYAREILEIAKDVQGKWEMLLDLHEDKCENAKDKKIRRASYDDGLHGDGASFDDVYQVMGDVVRAAEADLEKAEKAKLADV